MTPVHGLDVPLLPECIRNLVHTVEACDVRGCMRVYGVYGVYGCMGCMGLWVYGCMSDVAHVHEQPLGNRPEKPVKIQIMGAPRSNAAAKDSGWVSSRQVFLSILSLLVPPISLPPRPLLLSVFRSLHSLAASLSLREVSACACSDATVKREQVGLRELAACAGDQQSLTRKRARVRGMAGRAGVVGRARGGRA